MAYTTSSSVAAFCSNLTQNASDFSASTTPTQSQVNNWITQGAQQIDTILRTKGFVPPSSACDIYGQLGDLNTYYAVARAEKARTNVRLAPGERTRGQVFQKDFDEGLKALLAGDLSRAGLTYAHAGYVGGISVSDKSSVESDGDREPMRFSKNQFNNPQADANDLERDDD